MISLGLSRESFGSSWEIASQTHRQICEATAERICQQKFNGDVAQSLNKSHLKGFLLCVGNVFDTKLAARVRAIAWRGLG